MTLRCGAAALLVGTPPALLAQTGGEDFGNPWMANLRELPPPEPVPWWPPGPGWLVVAALLLGGALWILLRAHRRWRANAYRREALAELGRLELAAAGQGVAALAPLPALLKRVALAAYPRARVAGLHGEAWHSFLDSAAGRSLFSGAVGQHLAAVAYEAEPRLRPEELDELLVAGRRWVREHRPEKSR